MSKKKEEDQTKVELRVSVSAKTDEAVRKLAEERDIGIGEATDHLVKVAGSRLRALRKYAKSHPAEKAKPAKKAAKPPKAAKPKRARKAKAPPSEPAPAPSPEATA